MYIANANNNNNNNNSAAPEPSARPASSQNGPSSSYYKGVMSKRFDGKEDPAPAKTATVGYVVISHTFKSDSIS